MRTAIERFLQKINVADSGCWVWTASLGQKRYAQFGLNYKMILGHRFIYEYYHGQICPDLTIDHLCRNRKCVNPIHLEQVTQKVNVLRGIGLCAVNARKTHCPQGHEYNNENTYINQGYRYCKTCLRDRNRRYMQLKKLVV